MRIWWGLLGLLLGLNLGLQGPASAQKAPAGRPLEAFGYRHLVVMFGQDSVDVLVQSKPGAERVKKPLLLWCQGSLPRPLVLYDSIGPLRVFPFATRAGADSLAASCHLAIIGKPGIPLIGNLKDLVDASFVNKTTHLPHLPPALLRAKLPVFVGYGSRDAAAAANDYLHLEAIRRHRTNFTFRRYAGREHSYFRLTKAGRPDYSDDYFAVVGRAFLRWAGLLPAGPQGLGSTAGE